MLLSVGSNMNVFIYKNAERNSNIPPKNINVISFHKRLKYNHYRGQLMSVTIINKNI
jgi:hypothetical protein